MNGNGRVVETTVVETPEVFRGHFEECLEHLAKCFRNKFPKGSKGVFDACKPIAEFCKADPKTVKSWMESNGEKVTGEKKIRLLCFLGMVGYYVLEVRDLGQTKENLLKIVAHDVLTAKQVADFCGYCNEQAIYRILLNGVGTSSRGDQLMCELQVNKRHELAQKESEAKSSLKLDFPLTEAFLQRNVSSVMSIATGLLSMLETEEFGEVFVSSLTNLPPAEKKVILKLSDVFDKFSTVIARGQERK